MDLHESQSGVCPAEENLVYPNVNSCLTVTAVFADGVRTGTHLVRVGNDGNVDAWKDVFDVWIGLTRKQETMGKKITKILILGAFGCWKDPNILEIITDTIKDKFKGILIDAKDSPYNSSDITVFKNGEYEFIERK